MDEVGQDIVVQCSADFLDDGPFDDVAVVESNHLVIVGLAGSVDYRSRSFGGD